MENGWMIGLFSVELIVAIFAAELRNLRWATIAIAVQSLFLVGIICSFAYLSDNSSLYLWGATAFVIKVLLIPWLLWIYSRRMPVSEVKPMLGLIPSIIIMVIILSITFLCTYTIIYPSFIQSLTPGYKGMVETAGINLALGLTIFVLGIYVLLVRRDIIKVVVGLVILENGVHLTLISLAPSLSETAEIGIACNLVVACWLLLYLSRQIYELWGTKDSTHLSELKQ